MEFHQENLPGQVSLAAALSTKDVRSGKELPCAGLPKGNLVYSSLLSQPCQNFGINHEPRSSAALQRQAMFRWPEFYDTLRRNPHIGTSKSLVGYFRQKNRSIPTAPRLMDSACHSCADLTLSFILKLTPDQRLKNCRLGTALLPVWQATSMTDSILMQSSNRC